MATKLHNRSFFSSSKNTTPENSAAQRHTQDAPAPTDNRVSIRRAIATQINNTISTLGQMGYTALADEVTRLARKVNDDKFSVAVVGEFSRGKSTLINRLLGRDILPTGTLPTTALLTRITFGPQARITLIGPDGKVSDPMEISEESWEGLTAANFNESEPEGRVAVTLPDLWLRNNGIALFDAPGAGDTEQKRAKIIGQVLNGCDAALIAISASSPLSLSEINFIRQKLVSTRIPYVAVAITKLDEIPLKERDNQVDYIVRRLTGEGLKIPVLIASDSVELPSDKHAARCGLDKLRALLSQWRNDPQRNALVEEWLVANALQCVAIAEASNAEGMTIVNAKEDERHELILARKRELEDRRKKWRDLADALCARADICVEKFHAHLDELAATMTERLQHEVDHQASARTWVEKDYAYRVKTELAAASMAADNMVAKTVASDLQWLNNEIRREYRTAVQSASTGLETKDLFNGNVSDNVNGIADLGRQKLRTTVAITGVSLAAAALLAATGGLALLGTMGIGTGANIMAGRIFSKKSEQQKQEVKRLVALEVPRIVREAAADSEGRIKILYNDILGELRRTERNWLQTQATIIENSTPSEAEALRARLQERAKRLQTLRQGLTTQK